MTFHDVPFYDTLICDGPLYDAANLQCPRLRRPSCGIPLRYAYLYEAII